jgi:ATP-dependent DNA helicase RecG
VCPLIEESEALQLKTAEETYEMLSAALPDLPVGLVHGRLKNDVKSAMMEAFVSGQLKVLVATTVIEVGVDVPNASLMVIEHAERFGLAQLHQLRGRVRGAHQSACILIFAQPLSQAGRERLKAIYEHTDGFVIAREDLRIRGPGEFIGARQSGVPCCATPTSRRTRRWWTSPAASPRRSCATPRGWPTRSPPAGSAGGPTC